MYAKYNIFIDKFLKKYDEAFPLPKIMKTRNLNNPSITKGIKKSSRKKLRVYEKFFKNQKYKKIRNL